jgi:hypothetical protein
VIQLDESGNVVEPAVVREGSKIGFCFNDNTNYGSPSSSTIWTAKTEIRMQRHCTPVEVILRMPVVERLYGWSYQQTEHFSSAIRSS